MSRDHTSAEERFRSVKVSWGQVSAWRMRRQYLDPRTKRTASEIVGRLGGVQATRCCSRKCIVPR